MPVMRGDLLWSCGRLWLRRNLNVSLRRNMSHQSRLRHIVARHHVTFPIINFLLTIRTVNLTTTTEEEDMFAKLKESKLFKSLSAAFSRERKCSKNEDAVAAPKEANKTENQKSDDKTARSTY